MRVCPECGEETTAERCPADGRVTLDQHLLVVNDPWVGRTVAGKYRVEERIGRGGMGSVYRARHTDTDGQIAIKVLHASIQGDPQAIKRFHLEAQNAAGLTHSHTIRVTDFGVEEETPYLVMEYLNGQPLSSLLRAQGALPWPRAVKIICGVLKSLWEAHEHERRIVHRDIKPQNVFLVSEHGEPDFVKVLDFGISRSLESTGADTVGPIGTPHYMAPEQWRGQDLDGRADLYSCACILYEMLAGRPPFEAKSQMATAERLATLAGQHLNAPVPRLETPGGGELPRELVDLVHELLSKDPALRPPTAAAAVERLEDVLAGDDYDSATMHHLPPGSRRLVVETGGHQTPKTPEFFDDTIATGQQLPVTAEELARSAAERSAEQPVEAVTKSDAGKQKKLSSKLTLIVVVAITLALVVGGLVWAGARPNIEQSRATVRDAKATKQERAQALQHLLAHSRSQNQAPRLRNARLGGASLSGVGLSAADLQQADLVETDLRNADLTGADLRRSKLTGANLRGAVLRRADLRGADLRGAVLTNTIFEGSKYDNRTRFPDAFDHRQSGAYGPEAKLGGVDLRGADLRGASFRDANLMRASLHGANLQKAELRGANIRGAGLVDAVLRDADLSNTDLRGADLSGADLRGANMEGVDLRGARYSAQTRWPEGFDSRTSGAAGPEANLQRADLQGVDLKGADLRRADIREARLQGADLRQAKLDDAKFTGAVYDGETRWPHGFQPAHAGALRSDNSGPAAEATDAGAAEGDAGSADDDAGIAIEDTGPSAPAPTPVRPTRRRRAKAPVAVATPAVAAEVVEPVAPPVAAPKPVVKPKERPLRPFTDTSRRSYVEADLRNGDLSTLTLAGADLRWAQYNRRTRWPAGFDHRRSGALGPGANLAGKVMRDASIRGVDLSGANLHKADLRGADLRGCQLRGADLRGALLHGANLTRSRLSGARLTDARFSTTTRWPEGFQPAVAGAKLEL